VVAAESLQIFVLLRNSELCDRHRVGESLEESGKEDEVEVG
jgi:hypothetical protein